MILVREHRTPSGRTAEANGKREVKQIDED